jgi:hypothetical protein
MATSEQTRQTTGVYVYGLVPADIEIAEEATGIADGTVSVVAHGEIAALVSELSTAVGARGRVRRTPAATRGWRSGRW